jgi:enoyl-CoA hydratase/carnithine racemase
MTQVSSAIQCMTINSTAYIVLDNPGKHNALTRVDMETFIRHLDALQSNSAIRALVVTGSGHKTFCAGASLEELSSGNIDGSFFTRLTDKMAACPLPTVCALNGSAYGGGAELALCCDFRIGIHGMKLMVPAARLGLCYPAKGIERYVQRLGLNAAKNILLTTRQLESEELLHIGYLTQLVNADELETTTRDLSSQLASLAPLSLQAMKQICDQASAGSVDEADAAMLVERCQYSADLQEGLQASSEKRAPIFQGR